MVTISSTIDAVSVPVATPLAFVVSAGCVRLALPVVVSTTVAPLIGLPSRSFAVTVIVAVPLIGTMEVGAATTVDCVSDGEPGNTVTVAVCVMAVPFAFAEIVLGSATLEVKYPVATPFASVGPGCTQMFPVPVADNATVAPVTG
jgi:hypothetical protein